MTTSVSRSAPRESFSPYPEAGEHVAGFLDYLQAECGLSVNTRVAYCRDLRRFLMHVGSEGIRDPQGLCPRVIESFLRAERQAGYAVATIARELAAVRMFCRYLTMQRVLEHDPSESIDAPKKWNRLPTVLDVDSVQLLLEAPQAGQDVHAVRDRAILILLYATGMRASELTGLKVTDLNVSLGVVRVLGKGNKERIVPVAAVALDAVRDYVETYRASLLRGDQPSLFLSRTGRAMTREDIFRLVRKYVRRASLKGHVGPHTLRHCFATEMLSRGADLRSVQEMLGHADISSTQIYTHVDVARLKAVHKKYHPRG